MKWYNKILLGASALGLAAALWSSDSHPQPKPEHKPTISRKVTLEPTRPFLQELFTPYSQNIPQNIVIIPKAPVREKSSLEDFLKDYGVDPLEFGSELYFSFQDKRGCFSPNRMQTHSVSDELESIKEKYGEQISGEVYEGFASLLKENKERCDRFYSYSFEGIGYILDHISQFIPAQKRLEEALYIVTQEGTVIPTRGSVGDNFLLKALKNVDLATQTEVVRLLCENRQELFIFPYRDEILVDLATGEYQRVWEVNNGEFNNTLCQDLLKNFPVAFMYAVPYTQEAITATLNIIATLPEEMFGDPERHMKSTPYREYFKPWFSLLCSLEQRWKEAYGITNVEKEIAEFRSTYMDAQTQVQRDLAQTLIHNIELVLGETPLQNKYSEVLVNAAFATVGDNFLYGDLFCSNK